MGAIEGKAVGSRSAQRSATSTCRNDQPSKPRQLLDGAEIVGDCQLRYGPHPFATTRMGEAANELNRWTPQNIRQVNS
jgi:hypothetical protein